MDLLPLTNATVGSGSTGFGGLSAYHALHRWLMAWSAPDLRYPDIVKWAMPGFILLALLEFLLSSWMNKRVYYLRQVLSNIAGGGTSFLVLGVFVRGLSIFPYIYVHRNFGVEISSKWVVHILGFFGHDFMHYAGHRFAHLSNLGWASHALHHSSPDYNFMTAMRLAPDVLMTFWIFYVPLGVLVPPDVFFLYYGLTYVHQFLAHTQLVGKLPWLFELVLVTPSHHRVHHARNYPRSNFGAVLIIWDKLLGTFVEEKNDRPCVYGLDARQIPLGNVSPMWQQVQHLYVTLKAANKAEGWDKVKLLFTRQYAPGMVKPAVTDASLETEVEMPPDGIPCDPTINLLDLYVIVQAGLVLGPAAFLIMALKVYLDPIKMSITCITLVYGFNSALCLLDTSKNWNAWRNEIFRLFVTVGLAFWVLKPIIAVPIAIFCFSSGVILTPLYKKVRLRKDD